MLCVTQECSYSRVVRRIHGKDEITSSILVKSLGKGINPPSVETEHIRREGYFEVIVSDNDGEIFFLKITKDLYN